ncbi:cysteine dioxygenase [Planosporangium mesophilum]|uniref:cysteine dioxygenase n=1 Tax=Planosporangium mesophilum TaxID=689768 RepID=UPI001EF3AFB6|nr:cysteine dioxygenase family protein [Planosporangium mesophilum]
MTGLAALARRYAEDPSNWPFAPRFNPVSRWYARIGGDRTHEAWLLTWLPGQSTDLHDHGGSAGAFVVVSGVLTEQVATVAGAGPVTPVETTLAAGAVRAFGPRHVHRIVNAVTAPAVSLHVYAPSLTQMTRYRIDDGVLSVEVVEKAGVDW